MKLLKLVDVSKKCTKVNTVNYKYTGSTRDALLKLKSYYEEGVKVLGDKCIWLDIKYTTNILPRDGTCPLCVVHHAHDSDGFDNCKDCPWIKETECHCYSTLNNYTLMLAVDRIDQISRWLALEV